MSRTFVLLNDNSIDNFWVYKKIRKLFVTYFSNKIPYHVQNFYGFFRDLQYRLKLFENDILTMVSESNTLIIRKKILKNSIIWKKIYKFI